MHFLYISSCFMISPVILSYIYKKYDILWLCGSILCTSLMRYKYENKKRYQYVDHNWVKFVYFYVFVSFISMIIEEKRTDCFVVYYFGVLISVLWFWFLERLCFKNEKYALPFHMYVHFYTIIGFTISIFSSYDFNKTYYTLFGSRTRRSFSGIIGS